MMALDGNAFRGNFHKELQATAKKIATAGKGTYAAGGNAHPAIVVTIWYLRRIRLAMLNTFRMNQSFHLDMLQVFWLLTSPLAPSASGCVL